MRTMPRTVAAASSGPFRTQLTVLMLMLLLMSIGCLLALTQLRTTPNTTLGHLRSTWFYSLPDSGDTINSAALHGAGGLVADQTRPVARPLAGA